MIRGERGSRRETTFGSEDGTVEREDVTLTAEATYCVNERLSTDKFRIR